MFVRARRGVSETGCGERQILKILAAPLGDWPPSNRGRLRAGARLLGRRSPQQFTEPPRAPIKMPPSPALLDAPIDDRAPFRQHGKHLCDRRTEVPAPAAWLYPKCEQSSLFAGCLGFTADGSRQDARMPWDIGGQGHRERPPCAAGASPPVDVCVAQARWRDRDG